MERNIGEHPEWHLPLLGTVHADTILTTWIVMAASLLFFWWIAGSYRSARITKRQTTFEGMVNYIADLATSTLGRAGEPFVPFCIALFIFIFLLNQVGFLPFKEFNLPFGGSPTADLNTTAAYAVIVFFMIQVVAVRRHGLKWYLHLFKPFAFLAPINLVEEVARPVTLALRLFFNIFVGEILIFVVATIIGQGVNVGPVSLSGVATVIPIGLQFFNFFIGTLQAFVFTLLTIVYLSAPLAEDH